MFGIRHIYLILVCALAVVAYGNPSVPQPDASAVRAAIEDLVETFGERYPRGKEFLRRLENAGAAQLAELQREALAANPLVSGQPILFVARRQYAPDHHNTATLFQTGEINAGKYAPLGILKMLDVANGWRITTVFDPGPTGLARDPEISFDGKRIVFSMRKNSDDDYHIYEINVDGSGLKQLTSAPGVSDIDPLYLPDGSIVFSSSREPKYCMCNRHIMANLFKMEADGANIHQIGKSTLFEGHSALMPDGRILYDRWEYVDRNFGDAQGLWTVNPDGTNHAIYWGNNTASPGGVIDARMIPGTQLCICIFGSCHDRPWGALAIIDRRKGVDGSAPVVRTWPPEAAKLVAARVDKGYGYDRFKKVYPRYEDPWPLSDKYFLVSRTIGQGEQMGIYLLDVFGNEVLLHTEEPGCYDPMPIA
ncbi:MAG: PD40 domain-containing protein, partial [Verrucomicrobia bacterium]|nr:PD40 domain-containing protein [Verrucomicrobiota bacterium]